MIAERYKQTIDDLRKQLDDLLSNLGDSARLYDQGKIAQAKQMAVVIRELVHDTGKSKSLFGQLGLKSRDFCDTAVEDLRNLIKEPLPPPLPKDGKCVEGVEYSLTSPYFGLVVPVVDDGGSACRAPFDDCETTRTLPFEQWWGAVVFDRGDGVTLTRCSLVRTMANQDGGAHVDPKLEPGYADLAKRGNVGLWCGVGDGPPEVESIRFLPWFGPPQLVVQASICQIAHEVLKTLLPGYTAKPPPGRPVVGVRQFQATVTKVHRAAPTDSQPKPDPLVEAPPIIPPARAGRNAPCPCGSGKKYKKCCGKHC